MALDIQSYLLSKGLEGVSSLQTLTKQIGDNKLSEGVQFDKVLAEEADKLTKDSEEDAMLNEMQQLIAALDKSILGEVVDGSTTEKFAEDLLSDPKMGRDVIGQLTSGHLQAIVTTKSDDDDDDKLSDGTDFRQLNTF